MRAEKSVGVLDVSALIVIDDSGDSTHGCFENREAAGGLLAAALSRYREGDTLVIGLPRGGVEVADAVACELGADLDVLVSRKLRCPRQPELAMGALSEGDVVSWNEDVVAELGIGPEERNRELERVREEIAVRLKAYRAVLPRAPIEGRTVILTDDGVATGATLRAATHSLLRVKPRHLVIALPGGPRDTLIEFANMPGVEEVVALVSPDLFYAVGQLYVSFGQVSDDRVVELLEAASKRRCARPAEETRRGDRSAH